MKTVKFTYDPQLAYRCSEPYDQSGEYVKAEVARELLKACELIVAVKHCMMFLHIHDEQSMNEVLRKHGAASVQLLAKMAQNTATAAVEKAEGERP